MQTKSAAFTTMVAGNDLIVSNQVTIGFADAPQYNDVTIAVTSCSIQRSMATDAPSQTRLITGYPSAQATIVVSGLLNELDGTTDALDILNPYNPASPIYRDTVLGAPVVIKAGLWVGGSAPELVTMFTGSVDSYDVDPATGDVTMTCLDLRNMLRSVPQLTTTVCDPMPVVLGQAVGALQILNTSPGLTNLYLVDLLLRQNAIYASPPARAQALWFQSMCGGGFPQLYNPATYPARCDVNPYDGTKAMTLVKGYWSPQVPRGHSSFGGVYPYGSAYGTGSGPVQPGVTWGTGGGFYVEALANVTALSPSWSAPSTSPAPIATPRWLVTLKAANGLEGSYSYVFSAGITAWSAEMGYNADPTALYLQTEQGGLVPLPIAPGWHSLGLQVNFTSATIARYRVYVDTVLVLDYSEGMDSQSGIAGQLANTFASESTWPMECISLTAETAATPADMINWTPTAVLDASLNPLAALCDVSASDPWTIMQALAESEYALAGFDEAGMFRYVNRYTLRAKTAVRSLVSDASLKALALRVQSADYYNRVVVPINSVTVGPFQAVYTGAQGAGPVTLPPISRDYPQNIQLQQQITGLSTYVYNGLFPPAVTVGGTVELVGPLTGQNGSGYRACTKIDGSGAAVTSGVDFTTFQTGPSAFYLDLRNHNRFPVYFVTPTGHSYVASDVGLPLLLIGASPVSFDNGSASTTAPSAPVAGSTTGQVAGLTPPSTPVASVFPANAQYVTGNEVALTNAFNQWIQQLTAGQQLAEDLLEDVIYPRPLLPSVTSVADPSLQLADRLTLVDQDSSLINDDAVIFGIETTISQSEWSQALDMRVVSQPGYWVLDQAGHSEIGLTAWM